MAIYRVHFIDSAENLYDVVQLEQDNDEAAIAEARRINVPTIQDGFEVWQGTRLVHQHHNS